MLRFSNGMQNQWPTSNWELYFILNNSFSFVNAVHELFFCCVLHSSSNMRKGVSWKCCLTFCFQKFFINKMCSLIWRVLMSKWISFIRATTTITLTKMNIFVFYFLFCFNIYICILGVCIENLGKYLCKNAIFYSNIWACDGNYCILYGKICYTNWGCYWGGLFCSGLKSSPNSPPETKV